MPPENCGGLHRNEIFITGKVTNRAVVMHNDKYADYQAAARELAHLYNIFFTNRIEYIFNIQ